MKVGFVSLGCAKNLIDSENMMAMLKEEGHEIVGSPKEAEAIIVNTCGLSYLPNRNPFKRFSKWQDIRKNN